MPPTRRQLANRKLTLVTQFVVAATFAATALTASITSASERFVTFDSADGTAITAVYIAAQATNSEPVPGIVMLHGCGGLFDSSGKMSPRTHAWIDLFKAERWSLLLPDSFGPRGHRYLCKSKDRPVTPEGHRQFDALCALRFMQAQPNIDPKRIALIGWSNGAMTGLHTVMKGSRSAPDNGTGDFVTAVLFYPGCKTIVKEHPDYVARFPTLIQHGAEDNWTLPKPCERLVERSQFQSKARMEIDIYDGAAHGFDHPSSAPRTLKLPSKKNPEAGWHVRVGTHPEASEKAIARTMAWLRRYL
jgi:dienelactone hydrolase